MENASYFGIYLPQILPKTASKCQNPRQNADSMAKDLEQSLDDANSELADMRDQVVRAPKKLAKVLCGLL